ncbi:MAG: SprT family zinc-dependent metalloprotease [Firmicutes bacterium]|nr:SprT family zinc-dependent metalloprotease [Bacillota bacterium]
MKRDHGLPPDNAAEGTVTVGGVSFHLQVESGRRRSRLAIAVTAPYEITVLLPPGVRPDIPAILHDKASWILRQHEARCASWQRRPHLAMGGWSYVLGEAWPIVEMTGETRERVIAVSAREQEEVRHALVAWYRSRAPDTFRERLTLWAMRLELPYRQLVLANGVTRWGYCRPDGTMGLNWRLYQAPLWVLEYVVVHELVHRRYPHHQAAFWFTVSRAYPDAERARAWLKQYGEDLLW